MLAAYLTMTGEAASGLHWPLPARDPTKNGRIALISVEHSLVSPRDFATGLAAGKRQHAPITLTKDVDAVTPLFNRWLATNKDIETVEISFCGENERTRMIFSNEDALYRILLKKAFVTRVDLVGRANDGAEGDQRFGLTERISFVYDSITWEWTDPQVSTDDFFSSKQ